MLKSIDITKKKIKTVTLENGAKRLEVGRHWISRLVGIITEFENNKYCIDMIGYNKHGFGLPVILSIICDSKNEANNKHNDILNRESYIKQHNSNL